MLSALTNLSNQAHSLSAKQLRLRPRPLRRANSEASAQSGRYAGLARAGSAAPSNDPSTLAPTLASDRHDQPQGSPDLALACRWVVVGGPGAPRLEMRWAPRQVGRG
jgi:hypothetical protein